MDLSAKKVQLTDALGNDLLADVSVSNLMNNATSKLITDIQIKRETVIRERLKAITGIKLDIKEEQKRRFKRLAIEYEGNAETVWFNDGSIVGKRIVTFFRKDSPITFKDNTTEMSVEYSYY